MTTSRSPLYSILTVVFGLIVLAGGVAKLLKGVGSISGTGDDPRIRELLQASDSVVEEANQVLSAAAPAMQKLLIDFDELELGAYRSEKAESCAKVKSDYAAVNAKLHEAIQSISKAGQLGMDPKLSPFMDARSKSYAHLIQVNSENIAMIDVLMDAKLIDRKVLVDKINSIADRRDSEQKGYDSATATADQLLAQILAKKN